MPRLVSADPGDIFFQSFALGQSLAEGSRRRKDQLRRLALQEEAEDRRKQEFEFRVAGAQEAESRAEEARERTKQAELATMQALGLQAQDIKRRAQRSLGGPSAGIERRIKRIGNISRSMVEAGRSVDARRFMEQERDSLQQEILAAAFQAELSEVQDLVEDEVIAPEMGNKMSRIVQGEMAAGRRPGEVSKRVRAVREAKEKADERLIKWEEADEQAQQLIQATRDPDQRRKLAVQWSSRTGPSTRRKEDPDDDLGFLQRAQLEASQEGFFPQPFGEESAGETMAQGREGIPPEVQATIEANKAEREQRLGAPGQVDLGTGAPTTVPQGAGPPPTYDSLTVPQQQQVANALREIVSTPGSIDEIKALIEQLGIDISSLPENLIAELIGEDALESVSGGGG